MTWIIYLIETDSKKLYCGITNDLERRFQEHQDDEAKGAKFFRTSQAKTIVYQETVATRSLALKREAAIKKLTRQEKLALIHDEPLPKEDIELLKSCEISTYRASGSGGQHVNTTDSAIRIVHLPTALSVTSQKERSQYLNKKECLKKLREKIEKLRYKQPKRIPTKKSKRQKEVEKQAKQHHSEKKKLRIVKEPGP